MSKFSEALDSARSVMDRGGFRDAFQQVVDLPVGRPDELFLKIALMADAGVALRDFSILEYGLYLLERHSADILAVPALAPFHWLNLANLRSNLLSIREAEGGRRCWYDRTLSMPARKAYAKAYETAGDDSGLKVRILTAHGRLLVGLGRDWEAFGLFHQATRMDPDDEEARLGRIETLTGIAGTAPALESELLREAADQLDSIEGDMEGPGRDLDLERLGIELTERLGSDRNAGPPDFPRNSVMTDSEREHEMVTYALRNNLYLTPCAACRNCDRAVGDAAALGAHHAVVGSRGAGRYRRTAVFTGRLTERYRALRTALIEHHRGENTPDGADHQLHFPEVEGWNPLPPATVSLLTALSAGGLILEAMAACVALFLGREIRHPVRVDHVLGTPLTPGSALKEEANPALHGFWDLWADGVEGLVPGADLVDILGRSFVTDAVEQLAHNPEALEARTRGLLGWYRDLIGYLIRMADRDARGDTRNPSLWPLQPFVLPHR